jgi:hypothetical protein
MNGLEIQFSLVFYHVFLLNNKTTVVFLLTEKVEEKLIKVFPKQNDAMNVDFPKDFIELVNEACE